MSDAGMHEPHRRPHSSPTSAPYRELDLPAEIDRLHAESSWANGRNAKTLLKFDDLRVVLMAIKGGERIPEHKTEGRLTIQVLSGHLHVKADGRTFSLHAGGLLAIDPALPHDVEAKEDSAFLLTVAGPRQ